MTAFPQSDAEPRVRGAGGTPGGFWEFVIGGAMAVAGGYLLTTSVTVSSGYWSFWGTNTFGLTLLPFICGTGALFFNGKSKVGWMLLVAGLVVIFAGILLNLSIYFRPTTLFDTMIMLVLLAGGLGLIARSLRGGAAPQAAG